MADNSDEVGEVTSKSSKVLHQEADKKSETTNDLAILKENKVIEKVKQETIITLSPPSSSQKATTSETEHLSLKPKDEPALTTNTPPPPPPPPPSLALQQNLGNTKTESAYTELNNLKDVNKKAKNKTFTSKPLQAFFIPPQFNPPSENDINIKPSEYLKNFGNKSSASKCSLNKVSIQKSGSEAHPISSISEKEEICATDQLVNEDVKRTSDHEENKSDQNEKLESQSSLLKIGPSLIKPVTTRQSAFSVTNEELKSVYLKKTVSSKGMNMDTFLASYTFPFV